MLEHCSLTVKSGMLRLKVCAATHRLQDVQKCSIRRVKERAMQDKRAAQGLNSLPRSRHWLSLTARRSARTCRAAACQAQTVKPALSHA